jgi:hypothetical protein
VNIEGMATKRQRAGDDGSALPIGVAMRIDQRKKLKTTKTTSVSEIEDRIAELEKELNSSSSESEDDESESDSEDESTAKSHKAIVEVVDPEGNLVAIQSRLIGKTSRFSLYFD